MYLLILSNTNVEFYPQTVFCFLSFCNTDHKDVAKVLIEKGANIEARGYNGFTPLHYAVFWGFCINFFFQTQTII